MNIIVTVILTISGKNMNLIDLIKKLTIADKEIYILSNTEKKTYGILSNKKICYYLKVPTKMHRQIFRIISQNAEYVVSRTFL